MARILILFLVACASASEPMPDAAPSDATTQATCHREPEHDSACPSGTVAMSCFTSDACHWDPGAEPWVCCP